MKASRLIMANPVGLFLFVCLLFSTQQSPAQSTHSLYQEGYNFWLSGRFDQAVAKYKAAQADYLAQNNWPDWLRCQSQIATCLILLSKYEVVKDSLNHGLDLYNKKLKGDKTHKALQLGLRSLEGVLLTRIGKYNEAYQQFSEVLKEIRTDCPQAIGLQASTLRGMGFSKFNLGEYLLAEEHCTAATKLLGPNGEPELMAAIFSYMTLGEIKEKLFNFEGALACYRKVEELQKSAPVERVFSASFLNGSLGRAYQGLGDYTMALEYSHRSLAVFNKMFGAKNLNTINGIIRVADVHRLRHEWPTALQQYQTALQYLDSLYKNPHENRAVTLSNVAECYAGMGQWTSAVQAWLWSIQEAERLDKQWYLPLARESLAKFYIKNGNASEALEQLQLAEKQLEPQKNNRFSDLCRIKALIGRAHMNRREYPEAITKIQESLQLQCRNGSTLTGMVNPPEDKLLLSGSIILTLSTKADALYQQWNTDGGSPDLLRNVLQTCQYAIQVGERFRQQFRRSADENYEWVSQYQGLFVRGVAAAYHLFQQTKDPAYLQQAFALADRNKALLLSEGLQNIDAKAFAGVPKSILEEEAMLVREITYHEHKATEALAAGDASPAAQQHSALLFEKKRAYEALIAGMERDFPYYYEQKYRPRSVAARDIQAALGAKTLLAEYLMDPSDRQVYIFTISKTDGLRLTAHPMPDGTMDQVTNFNTLLQSVYLPRDEKRRQFIQLSHRLYRAFVAPIAAQLEQAEKLILIADGSLHYLPFELLVPESTDASYQTLPYLLRKTEVSYQYSATLWLRQQHQRSIQPQTGLLAFAPVFKGVVIADAANRNSGPQPGKGPESFAALPHAQTEARQIAQLFDGQVVTLLLDQAATEAALKNALAHPYRIVHIASHSFADTRQPKLSGIACAASSDQAAADEYILYADELYNLRIQADLVVLSSCESGFGQFVGSEGLLGLNRGFIYAGAANIIYSLWSANDQGSNNFMVGFYREILQGRSYSTALRAAKLKMLDDPATASPGLWGGFLLLGN